MIFSIKNEHVSSKDACTLLKQLTSTETLSGEHFSNIIKGLQSNQEIFVYKKNDQLVGMISVFIEQKIIHGGKCVGHIEDVVVDLNYRRQGIATALKIYAFKKLLKIGIKQIRTDNEENNPMYLINVSLGFTPEPYCYDYQKEI